MEANRNNTTQNERQVRHLVSNWAQAVQDKNRKAILTHHADNLVRYDVPAPFQSVGMTAYRQMWDTFFSYTKAGVFDIQDLHVVADEHVVFVFPL